MTRDPTKGEILGDETRGRVVKMKTNDLLILELGT